METVLLHKSAFLYVTSIFRLSSFVFANALLTGITKTFVPFYSSFPEIFSNLAINGECLELSNYYTRSQIADCQSTSGYATRTAYVCPRCNRVHEDSLNKFCGQCMSEIYTETIFGKVLNGHPVIYKGEQYPSSLFKRGKPMPQLKRYLQIERLFNN